MDGASSLEFVQTFDLSNVDQLTTIPIGWWGWVGGKHDSLVPHGGVQFLHHNYLQYQGQ